MVVAHHHVRVQAGFHTGFFVGEGKKRSSSINIIIIVTISGEEGTLAGGGGGGIPGRHYPCMKP